MGNMSVAAASGGSGGALVLLVAPLLGLGHFVSVAMRPWKICPVCKGSPRNFGSIYTKAFKLCRNCGGSGRVRRFGAGEP